MELLIFTPLTYTFHLYFEFKFQYGATNIGNISSLTSNSPTFKFQYGATNIQFNIKLPSNFKLI